MMVGKYAMNKAVYIELGKSLTLKIVLIGDAMEK
jgi:hypothetical protein